MFSKIKNLFSQEPQAPLPSAKPFSHSKLSPEDGEQCPFSKNAGGSMPNNAKKCPLSGKEATAAEVDSDSEEEKPQGGCPFMSGSSDKKKNPNLNLNEVGFDEPFVSKFRFYLSPSKLDFSSVRRGLPQSGSSREVFDRYPVYLQHTLFFNGEDYRKVRTIECCSRFMAYDQLREKGNKAFNKGRYYVALDLYERAMSLFRWLEYIEPVNDSTITSENQLNTEQSSDELSENGSKVNIPLDGKSNQEESGAAFDELRSKYKEFFITYGDENTRLWDGEDMSEDADIDMRKSLLIQVYLNMSAAYIHTHHYGLAAQICDDGLALSDKVSQLYFRKAQAIVLRRDASLHQLATAQMCMDIAIEKRSSEKIFASANKNILKMLNIHNSEEAYEECRQMVTARIAEVEAINAASQNRVHRRVKEIHSNEMRIIEEGKVPQETHEDKVLENTTEMKILARMAAKYVKVVEFYTESKNTEQVALAKKEFQEVLRIRSEVRDLFSVQLVEEEGELGDLTSEKVQKRVAYVKTYYAEQVYNAGKFNFTMLEWVIKEIVKEETEQRKQEEEAEKKAAAERLGEGGVVVKEGYGKVMHLLWLLPLLLILLSMFVL